MLPDSVKMHVQSVRCLLAAGQRLSFDKCLLLSRALHRFCKPKKTKKTRAVPTAQYSELGHFER